jgi:hypothetical protein
MTRGSGSEDLAFLSCGGEMGALRRAKPTVRNFNDRGEFISMLMFFSKGLGLERNRVSLLLTLVLLYACSA